MTYSTTVHVDAPVDEVFDFFADPGNFARASATGVTFGEVRRTSEGFGTSYEWSARVAGLTIHGLNLFTDFVPARRISDTSSSSLEGTWTYMFEPEGSGTRLHAENQVRGLWRLPLLEQVLDHLTARTHGPLLEKISSALETSAVTHARSDGG